MRYIIDRFEGNIAICEDEQGFIIKLNRALLPKEAVEGDVIYRLRDEYVIDQEHTENRRKKIKALADKLWSE